MKMLFATGNRHKIREANKIGGGYGIEFEPAEIPYPEIRSDDVEEVALAGADYVYERIEEPVIVEDSGLFIHALNGFPGAYSAMAYRKLGLDGILRLVEDKDDRSAKFISSIGYADEDHKMFFTGDAEGEITPEPLGDGGFAYDPIFKPAGYEKTFAEDPDMKNRVSHRKKAFTQLCGWLSEKK